jgi:hypothetical protein
MVDGQVGLPLTDKRNVEQLIRAIAGAEILSSQEMFSFVGVASIASAANRFWWNRLDDTSLICFARYEEAAVAIRFSVDRQNPCNVRRWNEVVDYTGAPLVYFRDEHWEVTEFIGGRAYGIEGDKAVDLALERLVRIQACPTEGIGLDSAVIRPSRDLADYSQLLVGQLDPSDSNYDNLLYLQSHASDFLPDEEGHLVLGHRDYKMANILIQSFDLPGCRVIDWLASLCPPLFDAAMFLIHLFNYERSRFRKNLSRYLAILELGQEAAAQLRGYLLLASVVHASNMMERPAEAGIYLGGIDDLLHRWV